MGDPHDPRASSFSLPPGCRFYPSQQQLLCYYLTNKNGNSNRNPRADGSFNGYDLIRELDLYDYDPFELPDPACFSYGYGARKRHWYCYAAKIVKESRGRRKTKSGYWRRRGRVRDVVGPGGKVVGTRSSYVFYLGNSPKSAARTDWVMYEYALLDHFKASFVLCRVFIRSRTGNSTSDNGLSSCAEESVSAVRHIGVQYDGSPTPDTVEGQTHYDTVDRKSRIPQSPMQLISELDNQVMTGPVSGTSFPSLKGRQPREPLSSSVLPGSGAKLFKGLTNQQVLSILEEDFIELDDLVD